jgi:septal ring factor EnvC (AmiA/AmiB activator)
MQLNTFSFVLLLWGMLVGGLIAWVILKSRLALAEVHGRAAADVERAQLAEQLKAAIQDAAQVRQRESTLEATIDELRTVLERVTSERTQFEVQAVRIPELEDCVKQLRASAELLNQQIGDFREQNGRLLAEVAAHQREISELEQVGPYLRTAEIVE